MYINEFENFQLLDNEPFANRTFKKHFLKVYHKQEAQLNQSDQNIEFNFGEINNYHQIGNGYLDIVITVRKGDIKSIQYDDPIRLVNNAVAFCFKEARLSTTLRSDIENNDLCGQVSTTMTVISNKEGDILSQLDIINENDIPVLERLAHLPPQIRSTQQKKTIK